MKRQIWNKKYRKKISINYSISNISELFNSPNLLSQELSEMKYSLEKSEYRRKSSYSFESLIKILKDRKNHLRESNDDML